mmetsp:Transcript_28049/g.79979  ORF Transcript_28049/g.79979 Transcript_28049/m.79979 type:complete len:239 (+) Transcript_28049:390-1106(+)
MRSPPWQTVHHEFVSEKITCRVPQCNNCRVRPVAAFGVHHLDHRSERGTRGTAHEGEHLGLRKVVVHPVHHGACVRSAVVMHCAVSRAVGQLVGGGACTHVDVLRTVKHGNVCPSRGVGDLDFTRHPYDLKVHGVDDLARLRRGQAMQQGGRLHDKASGRQPLHCRIIIHASLVPTGAAANEVDDHLVDIGRPLAHEEVVGRAVPAVCPAAHGRAHHEEGVIRYLLERRHSSPEGAQT